jgi:hypothetical protein
MAAGSRERSSASDPQRVRMDGSSAKDSNGSKPPGGPKPGSSYERYKKDLHAFFDGKRELPQNLREMLSTRPGAEDHGFTSSDEGEPVQEAKPSKKKNQKAEKPEGRRRITARTDRKNTLIASLNKAPSPSAIAEAIDNLRAAGYELPLDEDLLSKALGHGSDEVLLEALKGLKTIMEEEELKGGALLKTRLQNVCLVTASRAVERLCNEIREKMH